MMADIYQHIRIQKIFSIRMLAIVFVLTMTGCQQTPTSPTANFQLSPSESPTITPSKTPTVAPSFTIVPSPTKSPTLISTVTPDSEIIFNQFLSGKGPYLLYRDWKGIESEQTAFVMLDFDAQGRKTFSLPNKGYVGNLESAISPDGKWIAYHTGSFEGGQKDLALNLYSTSDGSYQTITALLSEDYPNNFLELGKLLPKFDTKIFSSEWDWSGPAQWSFSPGILFVDWSPDGRYLAFAGQMDGLSSDVYIYDVETRLIASVTDDLYNVGMIDWSPDGETIGVLNTIPGINYQGVQFQGVPFIKDSFKEPKTFDSGTWVMGVGWVKPHIYFLHDTPDGCCGPFNLRYIDVTTGRTRNLWKSSTAGYAFDPEEDVLAVSAAPEANIQGTYLVKWNEQRRKISDDIFWDVGFRGGEIIRFLGFDSDHVTGITLNGELMGISDKPFADVSISPDRRWYLLYQPFKFSYNQLVGVDLYSETDQYVRTITDKQSEPIWRPDSKGFFLLSDEIYYVSIPDGEPVIVDTCLPEGCKYWLRRNDFVWLP